jgi:hypothetical protein
VNEENVTPPPTIGRKPRAPAATGTPKEKVGGPSTPLARKLVGKQNTPSNLKSDESVELETPTAPNKQVESTPPTETNPVVEAIEPQTPAPGSQTAPKIMLRFTRPSPLPPAELASLPSPITPLPPSQSSLYPLLSHLNAASDQHGSMSIDQRLAFRESSSGTSAEGDYLSARSLPRVEEDKGDTSQRRSQSPQVPGAFISQ